MPDWSAAYWAIRGRAKTAATPAAPPRALDVETGLPIPLPKLSLTHRLQLSMIDKLKPLINSWLARRIAAALTAAAAVIGASDADTRGATAFASAACVFAFDCAQAWVRNKWLKPKAPPL